MRSCPTLTDSCQHNCCPPGTTFSPRGHSFCDSVHGCKSDHGPSLYTMWCTWPPAAGQKMHACRHEPQEPAWTRSQSFATLIAYGLVAYQPPLQKCMMDKLPLLVDHAFHCRRGCGRMRSQWTIEGFAADDGYESFADAIQANGSACEGLRTPELPSMLVCRSETNTPPTRAGSLTRSNGRTTIRTHGILWIQKSILILTIKMRAHRQSDNLSLEPPMLIQSPLRYQWFSVEICALSSTPTLSRWCPIAGAPLISEQRRS